MRVAAALVMSDVGGVGVVSQVTVATFEAAKLRHGFVQNTLDGALRVLVLLQGVEAGCIGPDLV